MKSLTNLIDKKNVKFINNTTGNSVFMKTDGNLYYRDKDDREVLVKDPLKIVNGSMSNEQIDKFKKILGKGVDRGTNTMDEDFSSNMSPLGEKVVNDLKKNRQVRMSDYLKLLKNDKRIVDGLISLSNLNKTKSKSSEDIETLKQRFAVLSGELDAGNTSNRVVREMLKIIKKLKNADFICLSRYNELKKILKSI
jgi:hypothetical protein